MSWVCWLVIGLVFLTVAEGVIVLSDKWRKK